LEGHFADAEAAIAMWERAIATDVDEVEQAEPVELRALIALERGDATRATDTVERFARERARMIGGAFFDYGYVPLRILSLAERLSPAELRRRRTLWLDSDIARGPYAGADAIRWLRAYVEPANSSGGRARGTRRTSSVCPRSACLPTC